MFARSDAFAAVADLRQRVSARAVALVARDGLVLAAEMPEGVYAETFGVLCATIVGAAAAASDGLSRSPPERIVVEGRDSWLVLFAGPAPAILAVELERAAELERALPQIAAFADLLRVR